MLELKYNYQMFNARILKFVFCMAFWIGISNLIFGSKYTWIEFIIFICGIYGINKLVFERGMISRPGKITMKDDEFIFTFSKYEKRIKKDMIKDISYDEYGTSKLRIAVLTIKCSGKNLKIYFEDLNKKNNEIYVSIFERLKNEVEHLQ